MAEPIEVILSGNIKHESAQPIKVEVTRGQKGSYGWTFSVSGSDPDGILVRCKDIDNRLQIMFPQPADK